VTRGLEVGRDDLRRVRGVEGATPDPADGEARIDIATFGLTSNNITYAVFGDAMRYWSFFPVAGADGTSWGRVPVWGFGVVGASRCPDLAVGSRVFGYLPMGDTLVVRPGRVGGGGFTDMASHRADLPSVYNRYVLADDDPAFVPGREDQDMLLRPLFVTSFVVDDFLGDHQLFGASTAVLSSASAKTAIGSAHLLGLRPELEVVGLTSAANLAFVEGLGVYDTVLPYDRIADLPVTDAVYIDVAGRNDVTAAVHAHYGDHLRHSMIVGDTHWDDTSPRTGPLAGPSPAFLFAPDQIAKRRQEWGPEGYDARLATAWTGMVTSTDAWLEVRRAEGAAAIEAVYRDLLEGRIDPRVGHICSWGSAGPGGTP
jgi:Protein of unknown function (DUF2855)